MSIGPAMAVAARAKTAPRENFIVARRKRGIYCR